MNSAPSRTQEASLKTTEHGGRKRKAKKNKRNDKTRLLSIFDVSKLVVASLSLASRKMREGKEDLAQFIANRGSKVIDEAIQVGWELEEAEEKLKRKQMTMMEIQQKALGSPCFANCNGARNNLTGEFSECCTRATWERTLQVQRESNPW